MYNLFKKKWFKFTYRDWLAYFQRNDKRRLVIDFSEEPALDFKAKDLIFPSIMAFQKGEHSEGYQFTEMAKKFAKDRKEPFYADAIRYFIREENFHSAYLFVYHAKLLGFPFLILCKNRGHCRILAANCNF